MLEDILYIISEDRVGGLFTVLQNRKSNSTNVFDGLDETKAFC